MLRLKGGPRTGVLALELSSVRPSASRECTTWVVRVNTVCMIEISALLPGLRTRANMPAASARSAGDKVAKASLVIGVNTRPEPMPWTNWVAPHSAEASVKPAIVMTQTRLPPIRLASQPVTGLMTAGARMYDISTQVIWSGEADIDPAMCGRATLAMVESSTVMTAASITEAVIVPWLIAGASTVAMPTSVRVTPS